MKVKHASQIVVVQYSVRKTNDCQKMLNKKVKTQVKSKTGKRGMIPGSWCISII